MMTRKDFRLIAAVISKISNRKERKEMAEHNAKALKRSNPRFNKQKFLEFCDAK